MRKPKPKTVRVATAPEHNSRKAVEDILVRHNGRILHTVNPVMENPRILKR